MASRPADLIRLSSDSRTEKSSSTTTARGAITFIHLMNSTADRKYLLHLGTRSTRLSLLAQSSLFVPERHLRLSILFSGLPLMRVYPQTLSHPHQIR